MIEAMEASEPGPTVHECRVRWTVRQATCSTCRVASGSRYRLMGKPNSVHKCLSYVRCGQKEDNQCT